MLAFELLADAQCAINRGERVAAQQLLERAHQKIGAEDRYLAEQYRRLAEGFP